MIEVCQEVLLLHMILAVAMHSPAVNWWLGWPGNPEKASLAVFIHVISPHCWLGFFTTRWPSSSFSNINLALKRRKQKLPVLFRPGFRSLSLPLPPYSISQSKSQGQSRSKEKEKRLDFWMDGISTYITGRKTLIGTHFLRP